MSKNSLPISVIEKTILIVRNQRVILDSDLAQLYGVETRVLNQAVKRNFSKFPTDFLLQLNPAEARAVHQLKTQGLEIRRKIMRSQNVIALKRNARYRPYAFTEYGAIMVKTPPL